MRPSGRSAEPIERDHLIEYLRFRTLTEIERYHLFRWFGFWTQEGEVHVFVPKHDLGRNFAAVIQQDLRVRQLRFDFEPCIILTSSHGLHQASGIGSR